MSVRRIGTLIVQATKDLFTDNGPQWAAAIAYYSLLSVFPLLLASTAIAAFFIDPHQAIARATQILGPLIPTGAARVEQIVRDAIDARGTVGLLSLGTLLWTGSRVFGVVTQALNIAYDADETYGFLKRTLVEVIMLMTIGLFFVLALAARVLINLAWNLLDSVPAGRGVFFPIIDTGAQVLLLLVVFFLIYRFIPRVRVDWRSALTGAAVATGLFLSARPLFLTYVRRFGNYNVVYGSLAIVIILVFWAWIVALIVLYGGEIASHVQAILIEGRPAGEVDTRHQERSPRRSAANRQERPAS